jgi:hypothetical protein
VPLPTKAIPPTATVPPTATPAVEKLFPAAGQLCEDALSSTVKEDVVEIPLLPLKRGYKLPGAGTKTAEVQWQFLPLKSLEEIVSLIPNEVRTLVCVKETFKQVGCYTSSGGVSYSPAACIMAPPANQRLWDVRLVRLGDKQVVGATNLVGGDPPKSITIEKKPYTVYIPGTGGAAGSEPVEDLIRWIQGKQK